MRNNSLLINELRDKGNQNNSMTIKNEHEGELLGLKMA